jgi:hypothetical protein
MKVLVTGASGRIGKALCDELLARGDEVVGLTRDPEKARSAGAQIAWHAWEPTLERPDEAAFEGVDGVVNLVGEKINQRWTDEAKRKIMDSRKVGTHNLVGAIESLATKPKVMVSQSAVGYYGDRGDEPLDESSDPGEDFGAQVCVEWERAAHEVEAAGVRLAIVRTGQVMETGGGILGELLLPFKLGLGGPLAGGNQWLPWIHLSDEVGVLTWALDTESVSGVVNGTAPNPVTIRSGRRRSDAPSTAPPCCRSPASRWRSNSVASSARSPRAGRRCCRKGPRSSATRSSTRRSTRRCATWSGRAPRGRPSLRFQGFLDRFPDVG